MPLLVQSASNTGTSGTTLAVTLGTGTTATNCLVVPVGSYQSSASPTVSGITLGGSADNFAKAKSAAAASDPDVEIWTDQSCAGSQTAVSVTFTGGSGSNLQHAAYAEEWSGITTPAAVDKTGSGTATGSTSWSSGSSGTLAQASEVAIGAVYQIAGGTLTAPGAPWTELTQLTTVNSSTGKFGTAWQIVSATTALTYNGTTSSSSLNAAVIVTLKGGTPVSDSDTGSGADTATVSVSSADAGSGAETSTVAAALSGADTGTGADSGTVGVTSADSGSGADAASPPPATLTALDTGTGTEGTPSIRLTAGADTGSGADVAVAVLGASGSDTGSGAESSSIAVAVSGANAGSGTESSTIAAHAPAAADTGSGADVGAVIIHGSDTGTGGDNATQAPFIAPPIVLWRAPDYLSKTGGTMS